MTAATQTKADTPSDSRIPILDIDPYALDVIENPYPFQKALRDAGPVVWLSKYGVYATGQYEHVRDVFQDDSRFLCTGGVGLTDIRSPESLRDQNPLMEVEPEVHKRVRGNMMKILSPVAMRGMRDRFAERAEKLVDEVAKAGSFDGLHDLVEPFILDVFPDSVGIRINPETVLLFGDLNFNANGPFNDLYRDAYARVKEYLPDFEEAFKRENMMPGGMGQQLYEAEDQGLFDKGTAVGFVRVLFRGGFDTTIAGIATALHQLALNPASWAYLRANPDKALLAFDEALRFISPFRVSHRVTVPEGCELAGFKLDGDKKVAAFMGAANRDPAKWDAPDTFDVQRKGVAEHVAFGWGAHKCIGLLLARYEAEALIRAVVTKFDALDYAGDAPVAYRHINTLRTPVALPLKAS